MLNRRFPGIKARAALAGMVWALLGGAAVAQSGESPPLSSPRPAESIPEEFRTRNIDLILRFEPGTDGGQGLGSLFELKNESGQTVLGAGFDDSHATYYRDNNRQLIFYYRSTVLEAKVTPLGKPYDAEHNGARLIVDGSDLVSFFRYGNPVEFKTPVAAGGFGPYTADWTKDAEGFCGVQWVNNRRMVFRNDGILYDGKVVYAATRQGGRYFYDRGTMFIYHTEPDQLYVVPWTPGNTITLEGAEVHDLVGVVFTWGRYNDEFLVTTNVGEFYSYRDGKLTQIRATDGTSWQGYSMLRHYDKLLIGHYPTGSLYQYDEKGLALFDPPIPVPEGVSKNSREAQTLGIYGGYLYAGVWPWGEVWRFDHEANVWIFVKRFFEQPELSIEDQEPYARAMKDKPAPYNMWGQRIVNLTNYQDAMYVSTMNKQGSPWERDVHDFLDEATVAQYGAVYRYQAPAQIAAPFTWKESTEIFFRIANGRMIVHQDGKEIGSCALPADARLRGTSQEGLTVGNGIYGPGQGTVGLVHFREWW